MDGIKCRPLNCVKRGLIFPEYDTLWEVVNYSTADDLWVVACCFDRSFVRYKKEEEIRKIMKI